MSARVRDDPPSSSPCAGRGVEKGNSSGRPRPGLLPVALAAVFVKSREIAPAPPPTAPGADRFPGRSAGLTALTGPLAPASPRSRHDGKERWLRLPNPRDRVFLDPSGPNANASRKAHARLARVSIRPWTAHVSRVRREENRRAIPYSPLPPQNAYRICSFFSSQVTKSLNVLKGN